MSDTSDHDLLIRIDSTVAEVHREMIQPEGRVPKLQKSFDEHNEEDDKRFGAIQSQISYWKGGIAVLCFLIVAVGAVVLDHILTAHGK